jgi:hypothetical protein
MTLSSLPARPLKESELRALGKSLEDTAPMVVVPDSEGSDIYAAVLVEADHVSAIVLDPGEEWRVLDRRERPLPPPVFEEALREWAEQYPELVPLC